MLNLTADEREEMYAIVDNESDAINNACRGHGLASKRLRHKAADIIAAAFDEELSDHPGEDPTVERVRDRCKADENCGFIMTILTMIVVSVIARLIVNWLLEIWKNRQAKA